VDYIDARLFKTHVLLPWLGTPVTIMNSPGNIVSQPLEPSTPSKIGNRSRSPASTGGWDDARDDTARAPDS
jgi:hypothetical protein